MSLWGKPILRILLRHVLRRADLITVPAEHVRLAVSQLTGPASNIAVFQYGVETDRLAKIRAHERKITTAEPREDSGRTRIVSARPLTALYHTSEVIRAVAALHSAGHACEYDVLGGGPEFERLRSEAASLGVGDCVTFHGHVDEQEVERYLARAHCYVSVAESDGVSIALLEAMALGAIPVISDIAANRRWVEDNVNGSIVSIDAPSIADGIQRALLLDQASVGASNYRQIRDRADRETNLSACETLLSGLVSQSRKRS